MSSSSGFDFLTIETILLKSSFSSWLYSSPSNSRSGLLTKAGARMAKMCGAPRIGLPVRLHMPCRFTLHRMPSSFGCEKHSPGHPSNLWASMTFGPKDRGSSTPASVTA